MTAYPAPQPRRIPLRAWRPVVRIVVLLGLAVIVIGAGWHGWELRKSAWDYFAPGRHRYDIQRNYYFGTMALRHGLLNYYEDQHADPPIEKYRMNYPTMRTVTFAAWAWWNGEPGHTPLDREPQWREGLEFSAFLHYFNSVLALLGATAAGLLVWTWTRAPRGPPLLAVAPGWRAWPWIAAVIAFVLYWYNPAGLLLAHGWPSPNAWVVPFSLWALLLISWECWFIGGLIIGLGTMFQGQHMLVAPFFVLWPLLAGQPTRAARWLVGFGFGFTIVIAPAMLTYRADPASTQRLVNWPATLWIVGGAVVILALPLLRKMQWMGRLAPWHRRAVVAGVGVTATLLLAWPALRMMADATPLVLGMLFLAAAVAFVAWWWGLRAARFAIPGVIAAQLLLCMPLFNASPAWWHVGFLYGTERHPQLAVGPANNLGALLRQSYGYRSIDESAFEISAARLRPAAENGDRSQRGILQGLYAAALMALPGGVDVSMRDAMLGIYGVALVLAAGATALQWRRRDRNFLLAATVPWLLFALLPAQMHDRYLGFAGLAAAVWIGAAGGPGWALLGVFISVVAYGQTTLSMAHRVSGRPFFDQDFFAIVRGAHPGVSWALLLAAVLVLYAAFTRARRAHQPHWAEAIASPEAELETPADPAYSAPLAAPTGPVV